MKKIPLTQGYVALVDDVDFEAVNAFNWFAQRIKRRVYAARHRRKSERGPDYVYLHRFILPQLEMIDHIDGDGLNCQRGNLRASTHKQNSRAFNLTRISKSSSYRGVYWDTEAKKWHAQITANYKCIFLGRFLLEKDAALAYDKAAREIFGEVAAPNFPAVAGEVK